MDGAHRDCFSGSHFADDAVFGVHKGAMNDANVEAPRTNFTGAGSSSGINPRLASLDINYGSDLTQIGLGQHVPPRSASRSLTFNPPRRVDDSPTDGVFLQPPSSSRMPWMPGGSGGAYPLREGMGTPACPSSRADLVVADPHCKARPRAARADREDNPDQQQFFPCMDGFRYPVSIHNEFSFLFILPFCGHD